MDLKKTIEAAVEKLKGNPQLLEQFKSDPVKALEGVTGLDLPDDQIEPLVAGIKAKLGADNLAGLAGKLGKLF